MVVPAPLCARPHAPLVRPGRGGPGTTGLRLVDMSDWPGVEVTRVRAPLEHVPNWLRFKLPVRPRSYCRAQRRAWRPRPGRNFSAPRGAPCGPANLDNGGRRAATEAPPPRRRTPLPDARDRSALGPRRRGAAATSDSAMRRAPDSARARVLHRRTQVVRRAGAALPAHQVVGPTNR